MKLTPMMQQYRQTKNEYPDCLLMFRVGDFFELFFEDAVVAAKELNIALTSRDKKEGEKGTPMAGVPHHALDVYLGKLVKAGYKVAICDQVEDPQLAKGLVKRAVVRVITPGTIIEENLLEPTENNWLLALTRQGEEWGIAFTDISTAEFFCSQFSGAAEQIAAIVSSLKPREIISNNAVSAQGFPTAILLKDVVYEGLAGLKTGREHIETNPLAKTAVAIILTYLQDRHIPGCPEQLAWYNPSSFMFLDAASQRNLEILASLSDNNGPSLLKVVDKTLTAMGSRKLKSMLIAPLTQAEAISQRLDSVQFFYENYLPRKKCRELLKEIYDLERITGKIMYSSANARDLLALARSLRVTPALALLVTGMPWSGRQQLGDYSELCSLLERAIEPEPPISIQEGNIIRPGYSEELDEIRRLTASGSNWLRDYEKELRDITGIRSLKSGFTKVFGYYIEVTRTHLDAVPDWFIRKQTLVGSERFETKELKEWEEKVLSAQEKRVKLEYQLFCALREEVGQWASRIQDTARALAELDCWQALAEVAATNNYCRPQVDESSVLEIKDGRHPVVEEFSDQPFVANDCFLTTANRQIMIITGPNMAGKSTYMRQVALIALLAQAGSFVPASYARIGVLDAIFTRIGASDDLASGRSTFMVEMAELAGILEKATPKSLVLLDEVGRGTGTVDGISIARATIEYLHNQPSVAAKTLFATHYHQLTTLADQMHKVTNCSVQVSENAGAVVFLHKIAAGGSDRSYGIHVARLAGLPWELVAKAERYLEEESCAACEPEATEVKRKESAFPPSVRILIKRLRELSPDDLSPRAAWSMLERLKKLAEEVIDRED